MESFLLLALLIVAFGHRDIGVVLCVLLVCA